MNYDNYELQRIARRRARDAADARDRASVDSARRQMQDDGLPTTAERAASFEHMCRVLEEQP